MIRCTFHLNGGALSILSCPGIGFFPAYSGSGSSRNNPDDVALPSIGPLPPGQYFIVSRIAGGMLGGVRDLYSSIVTGSDRSIWLALYRNDSRIDDVTFIDKVERGHFRLHPAGYQGISEGCLTLQSLSNFMMLRNALLNTPTIHATPQLISYGTIQVY